MNKSSSNKKFQKWSYLLDIAIEQIDNTSKLLELKSGITEIFKNPRLTLSVSIPSKKDNNKIEVFIGFRVQHFDVRGLFKGETLLLSQR